MPDNAAVQPEATSTFAPGQTWGTGFETREVEIITHNATGETLVGYQRDTGTALATEAEFAAWVREEGATEG